MSSHVGPVVGRMSKSSIAYLTLERFLPRVGVHVSFEVFGKCKALRAVGALQRLKVVRCVVDHDVLFQPLFGHFLAAVRAGISLVMV